MKPPVLADEFAFRFDTRLGAIVIGIRKGQAWYETPMDQNQAIEFADEFRDLLARYGQQT